MNVGTIITLGFSFLLLIAIAIFLYLKYRNIPVVQEKAIFVEQKKEIEDEKKQIEDSISKCDRIRNRISKEEIKQLHQREAQHNNLLSDVKRNREQFKQKEIREIAGELEDLQQKFIIRGLKDTKILDENIPRFGKLRKEKLVANGIVTAYDITFDRVSSIFGFGKSRANSLVAWRESVESQLDARKPEKLPSYREERIREYYIKQYQQLDETLALEKKNYLIDIQQIKENSVHKHEQNGEDEAQLEQQLTPLLGELEIAERKTEPFSRITFINYLKITFGTVLPENKFVKTNHAVIGIGLLVLTILSQCLLGSTAAGSLIVSMIPTNTPTFTPPTGTKALTL